MIPTLSTNSIFGRIEEESRDFRIGPVSEWPADSSDKVSSDPARSSGRYTRVISKPDGHLFYEVSSKLSDKTLIQVDVKYSEFPGEMTPIAIVMGGVIPAKIDENILYAELAKTEHGVTKHERVFMPMIRPQKDERNWAAYMTWAANPGNWKPQVVGLNYSQKVRNCGERLTLSSQLGGSPVVLQTDHGAQVVRREKRTIAVCRFVPVCTEGIMSRSWYFGLREAMYFLLLIGKSLTESAAAGPSPEPADVVRRMEPAIRLLTYL